MRPSIHDPPQRIPCTYTIHTITKTMARDPDVFQVISQRAEQRRISHTGLCRKPCNAAGTGMKNPATLTFDMNFGICKARGSTITSQKSCSCCLWATSASDSVQPCFQSKSALRIGGWEKQLNIAPSLRSRARHIEVAHVIRDDDRSGPGRLPHVAACRRLRCSWP